MMLGVLRRFLALEAASGLILMGVSLIAMIVANSPFATQYNTFFAPTGIISLSINDGLMAIFFLLIGLEIKREIVGGELAGWDKALLPVAAAAGGVVVPALIYGYFNMGTPAIRGWAIPAATDIAFSLGVLSLFGNRVPLSLKIFLMALAVIDDLIAVIIIAFFYTASLNLVALEAAAGCTVLLWIAGNQQKPSLALLMLVGVCLWICVLFSGVHATIAGVILGVMLPMRHNHLLIEKLHMPVAYMIIPLFAFANAGVSLQEVTLAQIMQPVSLGIILGLCIGKPVGIFITSVLLIKAKIVQVPTDSTLAQLLAVSMIAGIGFTMSLFIAALASVSAEFSHQAKLAILMGSFFSGVFGTIVLCAVSSRGVKS